jgi:hypothetical protein
VHVVKSLEPLFIMLFCWLMMRDSPELDWHMFAAMNLVVLGSINFSVNDATWNLAAFSCAMLSNASSALMRVRAPCHMQGLLLFFQSLNFSCQGAEELGLGTMHLERGAGILKILQWRHWRGLFSFLLCKYSC